MRMLVAQCGRAVAWFVMESRIMADNDDAGRRCQLAMLLYDGDE